MAVIGTQNDRRCYVSMTQRSEPADARGAVQLRVRITPRLPNNMSVGMFITTACNELRNNHDVMRAYCPPNYFLKTGHRHANFVEYAECVLGIPMSIT